MSSKISALFLAWKVVPYGDESAKGVSEINNCVWILKVHGMGNGVAFMYL